MKISVIMITHNRENLIEHMIEDVLGQSYSNFDYIIVDNGSIDKSGEIADAYAVQDSRVRVFHLEDEVSIGKARNIGLSYAKGEFVTYVDDDDRIDRDFLEFFNKLLEENVDFVMCGALEQKGGKFAPQCIFEGRYILSAEQAITELLKRERIRAGMPTKLFRKEILQMYPFKEDCRHEDIHTIYKYLSEIRKGIIEGIPKYYFVRHGNNISYFTTDFTIIQPEQLEEYLNAFRERTTFICERFPNIADLVRYSEWSFMISMCHKIAENKLDSCNLQFDKMKSELILNREMLYTSKYLKDFEKGWLEKYLMSI